MTSLLASMCQDVLGLLLLPGLLVRFDASWATSRTGIQPKGNGSDTVFHAHEEPRLVRERMTDTAGRDERRRRLSAMIHRAADVVVNSFVRMFQGLRQSAEASVNQHTNGPAAARCATVYPGSYRATQRSSSDSTKP